MAAEVAELDRLIRGCAQRLNKARDDVRRLEGELEGLLAARAALFREHDRSLAVGVGFGDVHAVPEMRVEGAHELRDPLAADHGELGSAHDSTSIGVRHDVFGEKAFELYEVAGLRC